MGCIHCSRLPRFSALSPSFFSLEYEGGRRRCYSWLIAVGNTWSSGRGMALVPAARPDDGQLDACVVNGMGRLELLSRVSPRVQGPARLPHRGRDAARQRHDDPRRPARRYLCRRGTDRPPAGQTEGSSAGFERPHPSCCPARAGGRPARLPAPCSPAAMWYTGA